MYKVEKTFKNERAKKIANLIFPSREWEVENIEECRVFTMSHFERPEIEFYFGGGKQLSENWTEGLGLKGFDTPEEFLDWLLNEDGSIRDSL